jgi:hypothetical protein
VLEWRAASRVRARRCLSRTMLRGHVEFLPLLTLKGRAFYVINVVRRVDCLDARRTRVVYSAEDPERIMNATQFHFHMDQLPDVPVFVCSSYPVPIFVRQSFVTLVVQERLRGFRFADPSANPFRAILRGISANVVAGALP